MGYDLITAAAFGLDLDDPRFYFIALMKGRKRDRLSSQKQQEEEAVVASAGGTRVLMVVSGARARRNARFCPKQGDGTVEICLGSLRLSSDPSFLLMIDWSSLSLS